MLNSPKEFKGLTVVARFDLCGETIEITTADNGNLKHWKRNGTSWTIDHIQLITGELIYP